LCSELIFEGSMPIGNSNNYVRIAGTFLNKSLGSNMHFY
jgi:hypothetical protein